MCKSCLGDELLIQSVSGAPGQNQALDAPNLSAENPAEVPEVTEEPKEDVELMQDNELQENVLDEFKVPSCIKPTKELDDDAVYEAEEQKVYQIDTEKINLLTITDSEIETMELVTQKREQHLIKQEVIAAMNERPLINFTAPIDAQLSVS